MKKFLIVLLVTVATILNPAKVFASDACAIAAYQSTLKQMASIKINMTLNL